MIIGYKVVLLKNDKIYSLFHATNGSREINIGSWNKADVKIVHDGTNGKQYLSGWHFFKTRGDAEKFFASIDQTDRAIVKCLFASNIRLKENSKRGKCWLADLMKIIEV